MHAIMPSEPCVGSHACSRDMYVTSACGWLLLCRVVFEQTLAHWEHVNSRAMTLLPSAAAQGGQGKKKKEHIQFDSQGQPDWDAEQVSTCSDTCCQHQPSAIRACQTACAKCLLHLPAMVVLFAVDALLCSCQPDNALLPFIVVPVG